MGTKIRSNALWPNNLIDLNVNTSISPGFLYCENQTEKTSLNPDSVTSQVHKDGCFNYEIEKVRQTILKHESIFRNQLEELHRLYRRQRELMRELTSGTTNKDDLMGEKSNASSFSANPPKDTERPWKIPQSSSLTTAAGCLSAPGTATKPFSIFLENKSYHILPHSQDTVISLKNEGSFSSKSSVFSNRDYNRQIPADVHSFNAGFSSTPGNKNHLPSYAREATPSVSVQFNNSVMASNFFPERSNQLAYEGQVDRPLAGGDASVNSGTGASNQRKRKIFGVEIPEASSNPSNISSHTSSTIAQNGSLNFTSSLRIGTNSQQNERFKPDSRDDSSTGNRFSHHFEINGKCLKGGSSTILSFGGASQCTEGDPMKSWVHLDDMSSNPAEISKRDLEHSKKHQKMAPPHPSVSDGQSKPEKLKGELPWFLRTQYNNDPSKGTTNSYFMNLDALQSGSLNFFQKAEVQNDSIHSLKQKKEIWTPTSAEDSEAGSIKGNDSPNAKKILGFPISDMTQSSKDQEALDSLAKNSGRKDKTVPSNENVDLPLQKGVNNYLNLRHQIDLNLSLDEEDGSSAPSLPTAIVKIASSEIDLEAPAATESEADESPLEAMASKLEVSYEESDRTAAEAIISISISGEKNLVHEGAGDALETTDDKCLEWFAEIISSQCGDMTGIKNQSGDFVEEESIPDGMDYFEFMTLNLQEMKEDYPKYEPILVNIRSDEETGNATLSRRSRRGQSRRGRQRRDFQRDILPSLATLSRHEVTEDLQAFEQMFETEGGVWHSSKRNSKRNGRGRKRLQDPSTTPPIRTRSPSSTPTKEEPVQVPGLKDRSFTGWGKRTRRLPRQRCTNTILSIPVRC